MRILFAGTHSDPGGAASHFISLTTAMHAAGHDIAAVAAPGGTIWQALERDNRVRLYAASFDKKFHMPAMRVVRQAIRELKPDWIIGAFERDYWGLAAIATAYQIPLALFLHHSGLKKKNRRVLPWFVRRFLLPSRFLQRWIVSQGVPEHRTAVLHNPIDTTRFRANRALREATRSALGITPSDLLVGYIGRIEANKGVVQFAESVTSAMARLPSLHALWVGFGTLESDVDRVIRQSPFAARHIRKPWTDDVLPYYAAIDFLVLPSAGPEAFGRVLAEAQACSVPVIGSDIGGIRETMDVDQTGHVVAPWDMEAWTEALCGIASDTESRMRMGAAGCAFVRREFDSQVIVEQFARLLTATA